MNLKEAVETHGSQRAAAKALGIPESTLRHRLSKENVDPALKAAMDNIGTQLVPSVAWVKTKGFSVLLRPPVKEPVDLMAEMVQIFSDIPAVQAQAIPGFSQGELLTLYPLADVHLGMLAWGQETGEDYDTGIAVKRLTTGMQSCVHAAPASSTAIILNAGDFLHANDDTNATPASKHALDTDSRHWRTLEEAIKVTVTLIDLALIKHDKVIYRALRGNHDPSAPPVLTFALAQRYRNEPRVVIEKTPNDFFVYHFGENMICGHHGDKAKPDRLVGYLADTYAKIWGNTIHRFVWTGHLHHHKSQDFSGMKWEQLRAITARDAYAASHAYSAKSEMLAVTYHRDLGEVQRATVALR
jgi:hypothetical protein